MKSKTKKHNCVILLYVLLKSMWTHFQKSNWLFTLPQQNVMKVNQFFHKPAENQKKGRRDKMLAHTRS